MSFKRPPSPLLVTAASLALIACSGGDKTDGIATETVQNDVVAPIIPTLTEDWVLDGFDSPESVIWSGDGETYYVSNVGGGGSDVDNNGVISIITRDGQIVDRNWVSGTDAMPLNAPKGMAIWDGTLYVTDIDHLVMIDIASAQVTSRIPVQGAEFLNDVSASEQGIFVTDSRNAMIMELEEGTVAPWLTDDQLGGINGLLPQADRLLVTTMSDGHLLSVDWETKAIIQLATGMDNADGVNQRDDGSFVISSWPGVIWHVRDGEAPTILLDTRGETQEDTIAMNDVLLHEGMVLAPNWFPGTVRAYRLQ